MRALFREYLDSLGIDLSFQNVTQELAAIPGKYAAPGGLLLLARDERGAALGCVALRKHDAPGDCEMKRLYVRPAARGLDLGRRLVTNLVQHVAALGYTRMLLDTLVSMQSAQRLYAALGFHEVGAYYDNPVPGTRYMALDLRRDVR